MWRKRFIEKIFWGCLITCFLGQTDLYGLFNVRRATSTIRVKDGGNFVAEQPVVNFKGTLEKETGGSVSGDSISFSDGVYKDGSNKIKLTGDLDLTSQIRALLDGSKTFKGKRGQAVRELSISGRHNRLEGVLQGAETIVLQDTSTSVTCAIQGRVPCDISLNGGTLYLEEDLSFIDSVFFTGAGAVRLNKRKLSLGSIEMTCGASIYFDDAQDIELNSNLHLAETWTFSGTSILEGHGKILYLEENGEIVVECGSSLLLRDVTIRKISGNNIRCLDESSILKFQNVSWIQDGNYSFTTGALEIIEKCYFRGGYEFALQSIKTSTIRPYAKMVFEHNMTLSFDPIYNPSISDWTDARKLLAFEDETSVLELKGATLHVTTTGMQLLKGELSIKDDCCFTSEATTSSDGIILGDGVSDNNDIEVTFAPDSRLRVSSGYLVDKNVL